MKSCSYTHILATLVLFCAVVAPISTMAAQVDLIVNPGNSSCVQPACYASIQAAITYADSLVNVATPTTNNFRVLVEPGTYAGPITLKSNIPVLGRETARTILTGGGSGTVVFASMVTGANFKNFTFVSASLGISVSNNSNVTIENNVFQMGPSSTAILLQGSPSASVINNTFYLNGIAINRDADSIVKNNIFLNNTTGISQGTIAAQNNITYNAFFPITTAGPQGTNVIPNTVVTLTDPLFANASISDFHLKTGSPCIDNGDPSITDAVDGTRSDIGAYGGANMDTIPFRISGVSATTSATSATLNWNPNNSYQVSGYKVYYGNVSSSYTGTGATEGPSPVTVPTGTAATTFTLSGLNFTATTPPSPTLNSTSPLNESLELSWTAATGATGYNVYYGTVSPPTTAIDVGNHTSYTLSGLTNGQRYFVAVSAYSQSLLYMAVTAIDASTGPFEPGIEHESFYSQEVTAGSGAKQESALSNVLLDYPEAIVPYPNLPNTHSGCFIATAAYGYYSAPQVQALRNFRDQFLMTNGPGRAFVEWYYSHGPAAAAWLNDHPGYKPLVRTALLPAVGMSLFLTRTSLTIKIAFLLVTGCFLVVLFSRKRLSRSGGLR